MIINLLIVIWVFSAVFSALWLLDLLPTFGKPSYDEGYADTPQGRRVEVTVTAKKVTLEDVLQLIGIFATGPFGLAYLVYLWWSVHRFIDAFIKDVVEAVEGEAYDPHAKKG